MKLDEVYKPVFSEGQDDKTRRLRSDFGSRKTSLECSNCGHIFTRRTGPNTPSINCPECGCDRVKLALSEVAKKKIFKMKESLDLGEFYSAASDSVSVLGALVGKTDSTSISQIQEALAGLATIEPGLGKIIRELSTKIKKGEGREDLAVIAEKMNLLKHFEGEQ